MTTNDDEMRAEYAVDADDVPAALDEWDAWLTAHDARVRRDAFEKGIAMGYMRGYNDSEGGLLYSPPIPPYTPEEKR